MKSQQMTAIAMIVTTLSACAYIDRPFTSKKSYQDKASFAIGIPADEIKISRVTNDMNNIRFYARARGSTWQCSYDSETVYSTDATCHKMLKKK